MRGLLQIPHKDWLTKSEVVDLAKNFAQNGYQLFAVIANDLSEYNRYADISLYPYRRAMHKFKEEVSNIWIGDFIFIVRLTQIENNSEQVELPSYLHQYELTLAKSDQALTALIAEIQTNIAPPG